MVYDSGRRFQEELYYKNLGEEGDVLKENSPKLLKEYFKLLIDYRDRMKEKEKLAIFQIELIHSNNKKKEFIDEEKGYRVKIVISSQVKQEDKYYAEYIKGRILDEDITRLKDFNTRDHEHRYIKIINSNKDDEILLLESMPKTTEVIPDLSDWSIQKEIDALEKLKDKPDHHHLPLLRLAGKNVDKYWQISELEDITDWKVLKDSPFEGLEEQRMMVRKALSTNDFAIIEGPPGSGKTTVITEIILQLLVKKKRVLLVGSTHVAVDNVLENLINYPKIVVPIRIAPMERELPQAILDLTYTNYVENFKKRLLLSMHKIRNKTEIQQEWEGILQSDKDNKFFENILNDSINLVSGTTFGVLKFPEIASSIKIKTFKPLFDVMIIDEASKTSFQEFLVPAMFARKWIVSGDPNQLSPFTDRAFVEEEIESLIKKACDKDKVYDYAYNDVETIVLKAYGAVNNIKSGRDNECSLISLDIDEWKLREDIVSQINSFKPNKVIHTVPDDVRKGKDELLEKIKVSGSDILIIRKDQIEKYMDSLPYCISFEESNHWNLFLKYRSNFINKVKNLGNTGDFLRLGKKRKFLSQEIAWRLIRSYELRSSGDKSSKYQNEIRQLIPSKLNNQFIVDRLTDIKCYNLPSIIEILITGNTKINQFFRETVLESGLPKECRESIWTRLSYQCRMHPDISHYPRTLVYSSKDENPDALKDSRMIDREWDYKRYKNRVVWKQISSKGSVSPVSSNENKNEAEANKIIEELDYFLKFVGGHQKHDGIWTVALLSFYKPQTKLLKKKMRERFNMGGSVFYNKDKSVKISIGNVDSMQGREADLVFLSMVRMGGLGFLDNKNRINVAITRARYQLVIVGNKKVFTRPKDKDTLIYKLALEINEDLDLNVRGDDKLGK
jgi:hypothetical protein